MTNPTMNRRDQVFQVAERLFSRNGYHATTVREIARELDLEGGSLYSHITGKQDLLHGIVLRASDAFVCAGREVARLDMPPPAKLREFMRRHLAIVSESVDAAVVYFHQWRHLDAALREQIKGHRDEYEGYLRAILREGMERGDFAPGEVDLQSKYIFSALNWTYQWYRPGGPLSADELADRYYALVMGGIEGRVQGRALPSNNTHS